MNNKNIKVFYIDTDQTLKTTINDNTPICLRCGKKLKSNQSKKLGYGPTCFRKHLKENQKLKERRLF